MTETETEQDRKTREYWAKAYDVLITNKDKEKSQLQYEPTAVLTHQANSKKPIRLRDILDIDFSR